MLPCVYGRRLSPFIAEGVGPSCSLGSLRWLDLYLSMLAFEFGGDALLFVSISSSGPGDHCPECVDLMRLATIKLAGFKSFVDPTTLHLPTNMTGVVGPNGCGKSNIIDAVRWVMGESSASRLRGDSLTDVIFSGASSRKPVSQALVELIFDNSDQTVTGEYGRFTEISVKRTVSRDGTSTYFLNGSRCRRRDITDLFLGTGLGPRSYSIIEQGMISQVIEARPDELRVYLEEAAGISKYKERRKETETRIRHTRENLDRLNDLREEIQKQLEHLKRQANQAEQYQTLQQERRLKQAQWCALQHRDLAGSMSELRQTLAHHQAALATQLEHHQCAELSIATARDEREVKVQALEQAQAEVYRGAAHLARIEQQIQHERELAQRLHQAHDEAQSQQLALARDLQADRSQLDQLRQALADGQPRLEQLRADKEQAEAGLLALENALQAWQQRWDAYSKEASEASRTVDVEHTHVNYLDRQIEDGMRRGQRLEAERDALVLAELEEAFVALQEEHAAAIVAIETVTQQANVAKEVVHLRQKGWRDLVNDLAQLREEAQSAQGRLASLETLQQVAHGKENQAALAWLEAEGLAEATRLGESITVDEGWETAVETVLGELIEGVLVEQPEAWLVPLERLAQGHLALIAAAQASQSYPPHSLAAKIKGNAAIQQHLAFYHVAQSTAQASALLANDPDITAVITPDGQRLGRGWVQLARTPTAHQGALKRERDIGQLRILIADLAQRETDLNHAVADIQAQVVAAEKNSELQQRQLYSAHRLSSELSGKLQGQQRQLDTARQRLAKIDNEIAQWKETTDDCQEQSGQARLRWENAQERIAELETLGQQLVRDRDLLNAERDQARHDARVVEEELHTLAIACASHAKQIQAYELNVGRMDMQQQQLEQRLGELAAQIKAGQETKVQQLEEEQRLAHLERVRVEQARTVAQAQLEQVDQLLREHEHKRQESDAQALVERESIAQLQLKEQALVLNADQLAKTIDAAGFSLSSVLQTLTESDQATACKSLLDQIDARLRRLEPVNLAAIDEYAQQGERAEYLDTQVTDLHHALATLEEAMQKIDRETRGRFKETFDRVNASVQTLYPRLFGGGQAYLELSGTDVLDSGVSIMARPPGKRVTSISLLSGGEKAMTAVALVFAIFQLNPAPFCLLDEVDAPLDEANVGRLASLVREMSEKVQFLFVSHNKATMEAADQLSGVTMREPGVSRLVSVDLAKAAQLAQAV